MILKISVGFYTLVIPVIRIRLENLEFINNIIVFYNTNRILLRIQFYKVNTNIDIDDDVLFL